MSNVSAASSEIASTVSAMIDELVEDFVNDMVRISSWSFYVDLRFANCPRFDEVAP